MATLTADAYRRPWLDPDDQLFRRCLTVSATLGVVFAVVMLLAPVRERVIKRVEQLPPRLAKLIVEPPKPRRIPDVPLPRPMTAAPGNGPPPGVGGPAEGDGQQPAPPRGPGGPAHGEVSLPARPIRPGVPSGLPAGAGAAGRARAQAEIGSALASSAASLSSSLAGLSSSLDAATAPVSGSAPGPRRVVRGIRAARGDGDVGRVAATLRAGGVAADLRGSAVQGSLVAIGDLSGLGGGIGGSGIGGVPGGTGLRGAPGGTGTGGVPGGTGNGGVPGGTGTGGMPGGTGTGAWGGSAPGVYRSNASLLAVIQRYAAGIQYCYGNELKRDPSLRGKIVVAMTVSAAGEVQDATIVKDTVGSPRLAACALSQIRDWRFPAIPQGITTFQAPFVFTPPS